MVPPTTQDARAKAGRAFMLIGAGVLLFAGYAAYHGREPFATWFFSFAWWSYILILDGWVHRHRGESLMLSHPGRFAFLAAWSVLMWLVFEAYNLRLHNWSYWNLPPDRLVRWIGYAAAFATVGPAVLETADLLDTAGLVRESRVKPLGWKRRVEPLFIAGGAAMLALPLLWPAFFFPLVWGGFVFLLEPLNERWGAPSLLSEWRTGHLRRLYILLLAGFLCGVLWEWWNAWSAARWTYDVPWGGGWKIFEMPALGYLGFPPFAVTVYVMTVTAVTVWEKSPKALRALLTAAGAGAALALFAAIDGVAVKAPLP